MVKFGLEQRARRARNITSSGIHSTPCRAKYCGIFSLVCFSGLISISVKPGRCNPSKEIGVVGTFKVSAPHTSRTFYLDVQRGFAGAVARRALERHEGETRCGVDDRRIVLR